MTRRLSALPRPLVFSFPSNRVAALGMLGAVLAVKLTGRRWPQSIAAGLSAFNAWAIGRELDPDDAGSANLALVLETLASLLQPPEWRDMVSSFAQVGALRTLACTVGDPVSAQDSLALVAQTGIAGAFGDAGGALASPLSLLLGVQQRDQQSPPAWAAPLALAAAGLGRTLGRPAARRDSPAAWGLDLMALLLAASVLRPTRLTSLSDFGDLPLSASRLDATRLLALACLLLSLLDGGHSAPLAAAFSATGLRRKRHDRAQREK